MQDLYRNLRQRLREAGIEKPELEARLFLKHIFNLSDAEILDMAAQRRENASPVCYVGDILDPAAVERLEGLVARRLAGEPVSRILGVREFWGLPFLLSPDTLDPRPDTETLVETALARFKGRPPARLLDIGTGTGCIAIALLHEWPETRAVATDISAGAIATARENAAVNGVAERMTFVQTKWADGIAGPFDLIVSNPPYIPSAHIRTLAPEVRNHDPIQALDGGADGLEAYRAIIAEIKTLIAPGGLTLFEIGFDQGDSVPRLVAEQGATQIRLLPDLAGIPRVVAAVWG